MSFEDFEGEVIIDYDSNTFTVERRGKVQSYDISQEAEWLSRIYASDDIEVYELTESGEYEVYGQ